MAEITQLSPTEEASFQAWARSMKLTDVDHPDSHYDYRGFWKATQGAAHPPGTEQHFPDTFKQHGHPTFSVESQYSSGPLDGGRWNEDNYVPPGADLLVNSRGKSRQPSAALAEAMQILMRSDGAR